MRVRISYGMDIKEISEEVERIGFKVCEDLENALQTLTKASNNVKECQSDYQIIIDIYDKVRQKLTKVDLVVSDLQAILTGLQNYHDGEQIYQKGDLLWIPAGTLMNRPRISEKDDLFSNYWQTTAPTVAIFLEFQGYDQCLVMASGYEWAVNTKKYKTQCYGVRKMLVKFLMIEKTPWSGNNRTTGSKVIYLNPRHIVSVSEDKMVNTTLTEEMSGLPDNPIFSSITVQEGNLSKSITVLGSPYEIEKIINKNKF